MIDEERIRALWENTADPFQSSPDFNDLYTLRDGQHAAVCRQVLGIGPCSCGADYDFRRRRQRMHELAANAPHALLAALEVDAAGVPVATRARAENTLATCCAELGIRRPALRWYAGARSIMGLYVSGEIWLHAGLMPAEASRTAAHEARHAWQAEHDGVVIENDADVYAARF